MRSLNQSPPPQNKLPTRPISNPKHSLQVCTAVIQCFLSNLLKNLPPDPSTLSNYSNIILTQTTSKLVDVNMLQPQYFIEDYPTQQGQFIQSEKTLQNADRQQSSENNQKSKNCQKQNYFIDDAEQCQISPKQKPNTANSYAIRPFLKNKSRRLEEDDEIQIKPDGIKFMKRQQLRNLIKTRTSNTSNSIKNICPNSIDQARITTDKSLAIQQAPLQPIQFKPNSLSSHHPKPLSTNVPHTLINKSQKSLSTLPNLPNNQSVINHQLIINNQGQPRISFLNPPHFINLKDYYLNASATNQPKRMASSIKRTTNSGYNHHSSQFAAINNHKVTVSNFSQNSSNSNEQPINTEEPKGVSWLFQRENTLYDEEDIVINKLRQRKEKFYRTGINPSYNDSCINTRRQLLLQQYLANNNSSKPANNQPQPIAFDYSGQTLPLIKYDQIKLPSHYQDMEFSILQNDPSLESKKKQRKGYMLKNAINLKLVDHQRFIPHPNYNKFQPLVEKPGMLMKENASYMLKKGVQMKLRDQSANNTKNSDCIDANDEENTRQRINKTAFEFLYNQDSFNNNKLKYQEFIKYKKSSQSTSSLHNAKSSKRPFQPLTESLLSKKSLTMSNKPFANMSEKNNKVHKSENRKALEMLINSSKFTQIGNSSNSPFNQANQTNASNVNISSNNTKNGEQNIKQTMGGVLKKNSLHSHTKSLSGNATVTKSNHEPVKKKVRIA